MGGEGVRPEKWSSSTAGTGEIKCPFFVAHNATEVHCEGIMDDSKLILRYCRAGDKDKQCQIFCSEMYTYCEIYRMLMREKYTEDDANA